MQSWLKRSSVPRSSTAVRWLGGLVDRCSMAALVHWSVMSVGGCLKLALAEGPGWLSETVAVLVVVAGLSEPAAGRGWRGGALSHFCKSIFLSIIRLPMRTDKLLVLFFSIPTNNLKWILCAAAQPVSVPWWGIRGPLSKLERWPSLVTCYAAHAQLKCCVLPVNFIWFNLSYSLHI